MESDQLHVPASVLYFRHGTWLTQEPPSRSQTIGFAICTVDFFVIWVMVHDDDFGLLCMIAENMSPIILFWAAFAETYVAVNTIFDFQLDDLFQQFGIWFGLRLTTLDTLHRFREVLQGDLP
jgi:hypothetical protein